MVKALKHLRKGVICVKEIQPKDNEKYREAFNTVVNTAEKVAPILKKGVVRLFQNPESPGTGLVAVNFGIPGFPERLSLVIGVIDTEGNPYTVFNSLAITEESAKVEQQGVEKEKPFTGYIRFNNDEAEEVAYKIPGRINIFTSPFKSDDRPIYRVTEAQFLHIEHLLKGEGVDYEIVEWPKGKKRPTVFPPGF